MKVNTSDIVAALRHCSAPGGSVCESCAFANDPWCGDVLFTEAANRLEEYVDRCARYAEEIAQLRSGLERPALGRAGEQMMDIREKLVELLRENCHFGQKCPGECTGCMVDHLIANGVTMGRDIDAPTKWIPVSERLPDGECLAVSMLKYQPSYKEMLVGYVAKDARYETGYCCESDDVILPNVTHWAEKPYPAEGGE